MHPVGCYAASKRKEILTPVATWMTTGDVTLSEGNPSQKDRYPVAPPCVKSRQLQRHKQRVLPGLGEGDGGMV